MGKFYYCFISAIIISVFTIFMAGCGVSVDRRADMLPEEEIYYEESSPYYDVSPRSSSYHHGSGYDPWTMGSYYEHYSGPPRIGKSASSTGTRASQGQTQAENNRPAEKSRTSTPARQAKAPDNSQRSLRKSRTASRRSSNTNYQNSSSQESRNSTRRTATRSSRTQVRKRGTRVTSQKAPHKSSATKKEEEDEDE